MPVHRLHAPIPDVSLGSCVPSTTTSSTTSRNSADVSPRLPTVLAADRSTVRICGIALLVEAATPLDDPVKGDRFAALPGSSLRADP